MIKGSQQPCAIGIPDRPGLPKRNDKQGVVVRKRHPVCFRGAVGKTSRNLHLVPTRPRGRFLGPLGVAPHTKGLLATADGACDRAILGHAHGRDAVLGSVGVGHGRHLVVRRRSVSLGGGRIVPRPESNGAHGPVFVAPGGLVEGSDVNVFGLRFINGDQIVAILAECVPGDGRFGQGTFVEFGFADAVERHNLQRGSQSSSHRIEPMDESRSLLQPRDDELRIFLSGGSGVDPERTLGVLFLLLFLRAGESLHLPQAPLVVRFQELQGVVLAVHQDSTGGTVVASVARRQVHDSSQCETRVHVHRTIPALRDLPRDQHTLVSSAVQQGIHRITHRIVDDAGHRKSVPVHPAGDHVLSRIRGQHGS
mmetsp:Transcript_1992/g.5295  ORF Transcript_1992/g.5295 Transcript_1992/m.5295 type:complete len:366 (-) Transcript_1992:1661-2758(-)